MPIYKIGDKVRKIDENSAWKIYGVVYTPEKRELVKIMCSPLHEESQSERVYVFAPSEVCLLDY